MIECTSFESMTRQGASAMLEQLSRKVVVVDWHMAYDFSRKKFVVIARFTRNEP